MEDDLTHETWRAVSTRRHREAAAQAHLTELGLATYLPLLRQWPRPAVGPDVGPLFPGYLFVRAAAIHFHRIGRTPGVRGLVVFDGRPAPLDESVIAFLREREGPDGVVSPDPLPAGSELQVTAGPLRGLAAIMERRLTGRERVRVLLDILHRQTAVEMPETWVRLA